MYATPAEVGKNSREGKTMTRLLPASEIKMLPRLSSPTSKGTLSPAGPVCALFVLKADWPMTIEAGSPCGGALFVPGKTKIRFDPESATYRLCPLSTARPSGADRVCADGTVGLAPELNVG